MRPSRPEAPQTPHVAFLWDDTWYAFPIFAPTTWNEVDITPFTQRLGTGPLSLTDLTGIAAVEQLSFAGGSGQPRLVELNRYLRGLNVWTTSYYRGVTIGPTRLKDLTLNSTDKTSGMPTTMCHKGAGSNAQVAAFAFGNTVWAKKVNQDPVDVTGDLWTVAAAKGVANGDFSDGMNYWVQKSDKGSVTIVSGPAAEITYDTSQGSSSDTYISLVSEVNPVTPATQLVVQFDAQHVSGDNLGLEVKVEPYYYDPVKKYYVNDPSHVVTQTVTLQTGTWQTYTMPALDLTQDRRYRFFKVRFTINGTTAPQTSTVQVKNVTATYQNVSVQFGVNDVLWNGYALFVATDVGIFYLEQSRIDASPSIFDATMPSSFNWKRPTWRVCDAAAMAVADGYMWYAEKYSNLIHYGTDFLGQDLEWGSPTDAHPLYWIEVDKTILGDLAAIQVGAGLVPVHRMVGFNNALYCFRADGAWAVYHDGADYVSRNVLVFPYSPTNFNTVCVHSGSLAFVASGRVWRYTGDTLVDLTPDERFDLDHKVEVIAVDSSGDLLWGFTRNREILVWANGSWHSHTTLPDDGSHYPVALGAFTFGDYYYGYQYPNIVAAEIEPVYGGSKLTLHEYYFEADEPVQFLASSAKGTLYTSWIDGGLTAIDKCFESVTVYYGFDDQIPYPAPPGSESWYQRIVVKLEYRLPDGSTHIIEVGRVDNRHDEPETVTTAVGVNEVIRRVRTFPIPRIVSRDVRLIFELENNGPANKTPRLYGYLLKYVPRPPYLRGYGVHLKVSDGAYLRGGSQPILSAREQLDLLWKIRDSRRPVLFRDAHGTETWVYLSAIKVVSMGEREGARGYDYRVEISLVETGGAFGGPPAAT